MFLPSFNRGSVLKQKMLDALRDFPHTALDVMYSDYGEGIISGFEVKPVSNKCFQVSPGLLKYNDKIYVLAEALSIEPKTEKHYVYISLQKIDNPDGIDVVIQCDQIDEPNDEKFELFRYTMNAEMFVYKDMYELLSSPMNRINQSYCKCSVIGGNTLHPYYFQLFANAVLESSNASQNDIAFAYQCLNGITNISIVKHYFNGASSNMDVLIQMKVILNRLKKKLNVQESQPQKVETPRKMVIS
ncbi:hypothetical protein [Ruminococcus sp.]|uniref:hypothetical protein n=1 Tax=Ruminococcus sp. TaxID=41978 RepID=UPI0025EE5F6D|nr:hypothetical protein [Ruminococcus sp.]